MAKGSPLRLLLIVTGSTLRAEELDRPLSYCLKQQIEQSLQAAVGHGRDGLEDYIVRVIADFRWIHDTCPSKPTDHFAGRPRVNALASRWLKSDDDAMIEQVSEITADHGLLVNRRPLVMDHATARCQARVANRRLDIDR